MSAERQPDVVKYFAFELTAVSSALFMMSKPDKAALGKLLTKDASVAELAPITYSL